MKKLILSLSVLAVSSVFAQKNARILNSQDLVSTAPKTSTATQPVGKIMTTLWSDDFSNASTWTIDNSGQSGATFGWNINSTSQGWWSTTGISSNGTSGGNNAELVNGNPTLSPATQALGVIYTLTTAQPIDVASLGGTNQVSLQFKQFGARFNDLQEIQISTDGTNFITVGDNLDKEVLSAAGGAAYPNPDTKIINLATFLSTNPTSVWVRFRWTTNFPGSATNPNVWIAYGWYIDDVKIVTNPDYDLTVTSNTWGTEGLNYYQIPTTQVAPISFSSKVYNGGLNSLSGAFLKADVLTGSTNVFSGTSSTASIASLDSATLDVSTSFTPPANVANYTLKRKVLLGYLPNGQILTGSLTNGSDGYTSASNVAILGGTGAGATVNITASSNGVVATGSLTDAGSGYTTTTSVPTTGGTGSGLTLDITATPIGTVNSLTVDLYNFGTVVSETNVATIGGTGTGLIVDVVADANGDVDTIIIVNPGSGYQSTEYLTVTATSGPIDIIVNATIGDILTATLAAAGIGYTVGDIVTVNGGTATYTVNAVSGGVITSVTLGNTGTGYSPGDVLTISGGSATYTVGTVTNNTEITDEVPANNTIADLNFSVTNHIYARDNNVFAGTTSNGTDGFEVGNLFDVWSNQTLNGLTVRLAGGTNGTTVGTEIFVKLYDANLEFIEESAPFIVASNNLNSLLTIPFYSPVNLEANNTYLAVVGSYSGTLRVSNAGSSEPQTSFFLDLLDNTWYYTTSTPVVRMNFDPSVGLEDETSEINGISLYPNPSNSETNVDFYLQTKSDVNINITDLSGKTVSSLGLTNVSTGSNSAKIDCSSLNSGVYYVTLSTANSTITKKFVKN
jgi:tetrahydromethanopterin S-methyltransferase subunit F